MLRNKMKAAMTRGLARPDVGAKDAFTHDYILTLPETQREFDFKMFWENIDKI